MILSKLASLNRQSLESLVAILEEKTAVYTEKSDNHQIGDLMRALKVEVGKLLQRLVPEKKVIMEQDNE